MVADFCALAPATTCNRPDLQDPVTQRYLLMHLIAKLAGIADHTDTTLKTSGAVNLCQQSPAKLRVIESLAIESLDMTEVDLNSLHCWDPMELEAAFAWVICKAVIGQELQ